VSPGLLHRVNNGSDRRIAAGEVGTGCGTAARAAHPSPSHCHGMIASSWKKKGSLGSVSKFLSRMGLSDLADDLVAVAVAALLVTRSCCTLGAPLIGTGPDCMALRLIFQYFFLLSRKCGRSPNLKLDHLVLFWGVSWAPSGIVEGIVDCRRPVAGQRDLSNLIFGTSESRMLSNDYTHTCRLPLVRVSRECQAGPNRKRRLAQI
jgi:hypothetical protein